MQLKPGILNETPKILGLDYDNLIQTCISIKNIKTSVLGFLESKFYVVDPNNNDYMHFITKRSLPKNKTIIILSATINERIAKLTFGDDVDFYDVGFVKAKGKVQQYTDRSYSRYQLLHGHLEDVQKLCEGCKVITFDMYKDDFNTVGTYGATRGLDHLKGEDLSVVGTPHVNEIAYFLVTCALGVHKNLADFKIEYTATENEYYRFKFNTYCDENLRAVQFYLVESELVQAVGRARVVREDCTVTVYSNYPVPGAEFR